MPGLAGNLENVSEGGDRGTIQTSSFFEVSWQYTTVYKIDEVSAEMDGPCWIEQVDIA